MGESPGDQTAYGYDDSKDPKPHSKPIEVNEKNIIDFKAFQINPSVLLSVDAHVAMYTAVTNTMSWVL